MATSTKSGISTWQKFLRHRQVPTVLALLIVVLVLSVLAPNFASARNFSNILLQSSIVGVVAVGATFVIITGGIDLSVGAVLAVSGIVSAMLVKAGLPPVLGVFAAMLVGAAFGAINGLSVAWIRLTAFIVTLATLGIARGLTLQFSQGAAIYDLPPVFLALGQTAVFGIPTPTIILATVCVLGLILLNRTTYGHKVFAVGGNVEAARLAGIPVRSILFSVYVLSGLCSGLASVLMIGRLGSAVPVAGEGLELQVIAAIVIGGTSLFGGRGSLVGTMVGVLLIATINNGLTLMNTSPYLVQIVQGVLIFLAVLVDTLANKRQR